MTNSSNLPAPYGGIDEKVPKAALKNPFCEKLLNFNATQAGISLRHGDSIFRKVNKASGDTCYTLVAYGNQNLFAVLHNNAANRVDIYNVETGALAYSTASPYSSTQFNSSYFNNYLFIFPYDINAPIVFNGTTWGLSGYTGSGFFPIAGSTHNARHYMIQYGACAYWYSEIQAISGPLTKIDLSTVVTVQGNIMAVTPITVADNVSAETFLAIVIDTGEVLFYSGSYPDSASWALAGRAIIGQPVGYNKFVLYQGDVLMLCDTGVVSLRDLFLKGSEDAASLSVNSRIQETWQYIIGLTRLGSEPVGELYTFISGVWDKKTNRIIICINTRPTATNVETGNYYFVFDCELKAWSNHQSFNSGASPAIYTHIYDLKFYKNKVLYLGYDDLYIPVFQKEGSAGFIDRNTKDSGDILFDYLMLSAPIPFPKTAVYEATQIEPIVKSDLYGQTNWNLVADFGKQTSGNQQTDAGTTSVAKPALNVGMQNITYVQVKLSGTTVTGKTVGLDLYSYNVWYNSGETGSR